MHHAKRRHDSLLGEDVVGVLLVSVKLFKQGRVRAGRPTRLLIQQRDQACVFLLVASVEIDFVRAYAHPPSPSRMRRSLVVSARRMGRCLFSPPAPTRAAACPMARPHGSYHQEEVQAWLVVTELDKRPVAAFLLVLFLFMRKDELDEVLL